MRLIAPEFDVAGAASKTIEASPDSYSQRAVFLLTPRQPGLCRIQLEVHGPDGLYLGAVALETEIGAAAVKAPINAAGLRLDVLASQLAVVLAASASSGGQGAALDQRPTSMTERSAERVLAAPPIEPRGLPACSGAASRPRGTIAMLLPASAAGAIGPATRTSRRAACAASLHPGGCGNVLETSRSDQ